MAGVIFDTSVYISALRRGDSSIFTLRRAARSEASRSEPIWLSSVVLEELYVGAADRKGRMALGRLEREFEMLKRLLVPNQTDWSFAGRILSQVGLKYGFDRVRLGRLTNDALISMSAGRNGFAVVTHNAGDYRLIEEFRSFRLEVV